MGKYKELREELKDINTIKDDRSFIAHNIVFNCSFLLEDCEKCISEGKMTFAYPIMRQVYEYIIILMAFDDGLISMDEFIKDKSEIGFIGNLKKRIGIKYRAKEGLNQFNAFKSVMDNLWDLLCERTHANFDRLLIQNYEYDEFLSKQEQLSLECSLTFKLLDVLWLVCTEYLLGKKHSIEFDKSLKKLRFNNDICFIKSANGLVERLLKIPNSESLFKNRISVIKESITEYKKYIKVKDNE